MAVKTKKKICIVYPSDISFNKFTKKVKLLIEAKQVKVEYISNV